LARRLLARRLLVRRLLNSLLPNVDLIFSDAGETENAQEIESKP
jgi:hypothetical protein